MEKLNLYKMEIKDINELYDNLHVKHVEKYHENQIEEARGEYQRWYEFILNSPYFYLFIVRDENSNLKGLIKFEHSEETAIVNIYLVESVREKGYGKKLLEESFEKIKSIWELESLEAYILKENVASTSLFKSLGFEFIKNTDYKGIGHCLYVKNLN